MKAFSLPVFLLSNSLKGGGAEVLSLELSKELKIPLILAESIFEHAPKDESMYCLSGLNEQDAALKKYLLLPFLAFRLSKKLPEDSVLVVSLFRSLLIALFCKLFFKKTRIIYWLHSNPNTLPLPAFSFFIRPFFARCFHNCEALVCNSAQAKANLSTLYKLPNSKIHLIYNFFDIEKIQSASKEALPEAYQNIFNKKVLLNIARLDKQKGQHHLIRIFSELSQLQPDYILVIIGNGSFKLELEQLISDFQLKEKVFILPFQPNPFPFFLQSEIFLFSSYSEGFGNVLVEALACSCYPVSSDIDHGPREILGPDSHLKKRTNFPDFAKYGLLMPKFAETPPSKSALTSIERDWLASVCDLINRAEHLEKMRSFLPFGAKQFESKEILPFWEKIIEEISRQKQ